MVICSPNFNFLIKNQGIKLMLAPRSHNAALLNVCSLIIHERVKLLGFLSFSGNSLCIIALQFFERFIVSMMSNFFLFDTIYFINLIELGI